MGWASEMEWHVGQSTGVVSREGRQGGEDAGRGSGLSWFFFFQAEDGIRDISV